LKRFKRFFRDIKTYRVTGQVTETKTEWGNHQTMIYLRTRR
jgi:hypothetical protein